MTDEKEKLLVSKKDKNVGLKLSNLRSIGYGSGEQNTVKTVPHNDRIAYTWSELNVFVSEKPKSRTRFFKFSGEDVEQRKHILKNVSGLAYPGELLAILGSSGAGKTTLLNSLTFRSPANVVITGLRCVNGIPVNSSSLTSQSAYVQQDDLFMGNLTVREHLIFQALLRMDKHIPYNHRMKRVEEIISELALTKCQNTRIGIPGRTKGISGGERKRLAFGAEVLTNPSLLFCDEPTSGLDSFMALNVVQVLKTLAKSGKTVVCTIHQPSSEVYAMFDKVLFMAEGRVAFLGTPDEADLFFTSLSAPCPKNYNPADYYIQLLAINPEEEESCKQAITMICNNYEKSQYGQNLATVASTMSKMDMSYDFWTGNEKDICPYKASWWVQFRAVLWRSFICIMKNPILIKNRLLQTLIVAIVVGLIYFQQEITEEGVMNINGVMFIFLTSMTFQNLYAVVQVFCSEYPIFHREHMNGMYRTDVYFLCKTFAEMPFFCLLPILFISVCYYMIGLNPDFIKFLITCGIAVLVTNAVISFGYLISCATSSESMALTIGPPLIVPFLFFGGFFLNIRSIPIYFQWLSYFSWFRFGFEAFMINQWKDVTNIDCSTSNTTTCPKNGKVVLEIYSFSEENFTMDIVMLIILIVTFRLMAYFSLLCKTLKRE